MYLWPVCLALLASQMLTQVEKQEWQPRATGENKELVGIRKVGWNLLDSISMTARYSSFILSKVNSLFIQGFCQTIMVLHRTRQQVQIFALQVMSLNWHKLITFENFVRNIIRVMNILVWAIYHTFWTHTMFSPFHMVKCVTCMLVQCIFSACSYCAPCVAS